MAIDEAQSDSAGPSTLRDLLAVPGYRALGISSWLWHATRWGGLFSTSYLLSQLANSPLLSQAVGALIFAPMLLGGILMGAVSDRLDRRRLILGTQLVLIPVSAVMALAVSTGAVRVWMTFPFMFAVGCGGLLNMTAQRPLIYETVGPALAPRALTIETTAQASAGVVGTLVGGALIQVVGVGASFAGMALLLCISAALLATVPSGQRALRGAGGVTTSFVAQLRAGIALMRNNPRMVSMLGVTVIQNVFYFSYIPLLPLVAKQYGADAAVVGALSATAGCGQILGGAVSASGPVRRHGLIFAGGAGIALIGLSAFAAAPVLGVAFVALLVAGTGQAGFASMQSLLAVESAPPSERGAALGVLSTAIGALPVGMVLIGVSAEFLGARQALFISALTGLSALMWLMSRSPELLAPRLERDV